MAAETRPESDRRTTESPQTPINIRDRFGRVTKSAASSQKGRAALSAPMETTDAPMHADADHRRLFGLNMARARGLADHRTQEPLAGIRGVDRRMINRWERGGREPRGPMRRQIADTLGQSLDFFYDET